MDGKEQASRQRLAEAEMCPLWRVADIDVDLRHEVDGGGMGECAGGSSDRDQMPAEMAVAGGGVNGQVRSGVGGRRTELCAGHTGT
jgi:hypothetical protein